MWLLIKTLFEIKLKQLLSFNVANIQIEIELVIQMNAEKFC